MREEFREIYDIVKESPKIDEILGEGIEESLEKAGSLSDVIEIITNIKDFRTASEFGWYKTLGSLAEKYPEYQNKLDETRQRFMKADVYDNVEDFCASMVKLIKNDRADDRTVYECVSGISNLVNIPDIDKDSLLCVDRYMKSIGTVENEKTQDKLLDIYESLLQHDVEKVGNLYFYWEQNVKNASPEKQIKIIEKYAKGQIVENWVDNIINNHPDGAQWLLNYIKENNVNCNCTIINILLAHIPDKENDCLILYQKFIDKNSLYKAFGNALSDISKSNPQMVMNILDYIKNNNQKGIICLDYLCDIAVDCAESDSQQLEKAYEFIKWAVMKNNMLAKRLNTISLKREDFPLRTMQFYEQLLSSPEDIYDRCYGVENFLELHPQFREDFWSVAEKIVVGHNYANHILNILKLEKDKDEIHSERFLRLEKQVLDYELSENHSINYKYCSYLNDIVEKNPDYLIKYIQRLDINEDDFKEWFPILETSIKNNPDKADVFLPVMAHILSKIDESELAESYLDLLKSMDVKGVAQIPQDEQINLIDNIYQVEHPKSYYRYDNENPLEKNERTYDIYAILVKKGLCSKATIDYILGEYEHIPGANSLLNEIVASKILSATKICELIKQYPEFDVIKTANKVYNTRETQAIYKKAEQQSQHQKYIEAILDEIPAGDKTKALIDFANEVVKTKDDAKINKFKELLFASGEDKVFELDHKAMEWFVNNGRPEDLEALNNLRQLYGLKTELSEYWHIDPNVNDALRIRFDGSYSEIGAVNYNPQADCEEDNPHYYRKLSQAYQDFRPDYSRDFKPSEYNLHENEAFETLGKHGVKMPIKMLQEAFVEMHMPPEVAQQLNATDLQHVLVNYCYWKNDWEHDSQYDSSSSNDLTKRIKEVRRGDKISMKDLSSKGLTSIREKKWKAFARNKQLVDFISKDMQRYGIEQNVINMFWDNARHYGTPVCYDESGRADFYGLRSSLHHAEPLRQGGTNEQSTIITLNIQKAGYVEKERYDYETGEEYTRTYWNDGGNMEVHSHDPFHFFDNPCCYLYLKKDGHLTLKNREWKNMKRMMIITKPAAKLNEGEQVVYFGGPRECSCAIMDYKNGNIRRASYKFWKSNDVKSKQNIKTSKTR